MEGKIIILGGPSGAGKTTIANKLDNLIKKVVSTTTRAPRKGEINGVDYHFVSKDEFIKRKEEGGFIEYTEYAGQYYGTSKDEIERIIKENEKAIIVMDINGVNCLKKNYPNNTIAIFIDRPNDKLEAAINKRTIPDEEKARRLLLIKRDREYQSNYDYILMNNRSPEDAAHSLLQLIENKN